MEQNQSAEAAILTQSPPAPAPAEQPLLIAAADAELASLRAARFRLADQLNQHRSELISISERLRAAGVSLDELERLQARASALARSIANCQSEDVRLEREVSLAADRRQVLIQEAEYFSGLRGRLQGEIFDLRARRENMLRELEQMTVIIQQSEEQLQATSLRLEQIGELPKSPNFRVTQW